MNDYFEIIWDRTSFDIPVWVCIDECYLYMHESLSVLNVILISEYKNPKHLVG